MLEYYRIQIFFYYKDLVNGHLIKVCIGENLSATGKQVSGNHNLKVQLTRLRQPVSFCCLVSFGGLH